MALGAEGDAALRVQLARDEQRLEVGDRAARREVAEVLLAVAEHRGQPRDDLALHLRRRRPAVERVVVGVDEHRRQLPGDRRGVRRLEHLPGVAGMEEGVVVAQPLRQLRERRLHPLLGDVERGVRLERRVLRPASADGWRALRRASVRRPCPARYGPERYSGSPPPGVSPSSGGGGDAWRPVRRGRRLRPRHLVGRIRDPESGVAVTVARTAASLSRRAGSRFERASAGTSARSDATRRAGAPFGAGGSSRVARPATNASGDQRERSRSRERPDQHFLRSAVRPGSMQRLRIRGSPAPRLIVNRIARPT